MTAVRPRWLRLTARSNAYAGDNDESKDNKDGEQYGCGTWRTRCQRASSDWLAAFRIFDEPQGHRHDVSCVRACCRRDRRGDVGRDPHGIAESRRDDLPYAP